MLRLVAERLPADLLLKRRTQGRRIRSLNGRRGGVSQGLTGGRLAWFDRTGREIGSLATDGSYDNVRLSRDGMFAVFDRIDREAGTADIWSIEIARGTSLRLTSELTNERTPVFSPDGRSIAYASEQSGPFDLYRMPATGGAREEVLLHSALTKNVDDWSPDGGPHRHRP